MARSNGQNSRRVEGNQFQSRNGWTKSTSDTSRTNRRSGGLSFKGGSRGR